MRGGRPAFKARLSDQPCNVRRRLTTSSSFFTLGGISIALMRNNQGAGAVVAASLVSGLAVAVAGPLPGIQRMRFRFVLASSSHSA
jgi:hypothetical protein